MGIVNSYFPVDKVRNFLSRKKMYQALNYLFASTFGVITPFVPVHLFLCLLVL